MHPIKTIDPQTHSFTEVVTCDSSPPSCLYYRGALPDDRRPTVAIVGTRKPSSYGKEITHRIAYELAKQGAVIVSGLAYGVDGIAHRAALEAQGTTIAILAHGLHKTYPTAHRQLAEDILANNGALMSEYPSGTEAKKHTFLQRNRIVSGLADVVIITEAAAKSGTLNTAGHALNQGKQLYAVPGNISQPSSAGCNQLLLQGATPLIDVSQIIETLKLAPTDAKQLAIPLGDTELENNIIACLANGERDGDAILDHLSAEPSDFNTALTMLEINGTIKSLGANQWSL